MISTIGRSPANAAPTPSPAMVSSLIGVSLTRHGPNFSSNPRLAPNGPPGAATSSPASVTVSSRAISSVSASLTACQYFSSRISSGLRVDVARHFVGAREFRRLGEGDRLRHDAIHPFVDLIEGRGVDTGSAGQVSAKQIDRVALFPLRPFPGWLVALRVALKMAAHP